MKTTCSILLLAVSGLLGLAAEYRCCLPWEVVVVNEQGQPLPDCTVVQEWGYNFGNNATNFNEQVTTDKAGRVRLPQRGVAYPKTTAEKVADRLMVRPGLGSWANVFVWKRGYDGQFVYLKHDSRVLYTTNGLLSRVVLRPAETPK